MTQYDIEYRRTVPPYDVVEVFVGSAEQVIDRLCRLSRVDVLAYDVEVIRREIDGDEYAASGSPDARALARAIAAGGSVKWAGATAPPREDTRPAE